MKEEKKGLLAVGLLLLAAIPLVLLTRKPVNRVVRVSVTNAPVGVELWQLAVFRSEMGESVAVWEVPISESAQVEIPEGWTPPFLVDIVLYNQARTIVLRAQSAFGPTWLDYYDINVPSFGTFVFDWPTKSLS